jgi:alpha-beta hydrolase superfamily lysophospholipase
MGSVVSKDRGRLWRKILLVVAITLCILFGVCRFAASHLMGEMLTTGPNGPETPATAGVPFERVEIPSGPRRLDSYVVTANSTCSNPPVVLIYHGVQETISEWVKAQRFLYDHCVSSVVFDYTGSGNSSRPARFEAVAEDSVAAYEFAAGHFPGRPLYILGHSMGNGPMLEAVPHFSSRPAGVVVANAFASLRSAAGTRNNVLYSVLAYTIPDWWDNVKSVQQIHVPLLVIHSDTDQVNPADGARRIFAAAQQPKKLALLHGFRHNALYQQPSEEWWSAVLAFVNAVKLVGAEPLLQKASSGTPYRAAVRAHHAGFPFFMSTGEA